MLEPGARIRVVLTAGASLVVYPGLGFVCLCGFITNKSLGKRPCEAWKKAGIRLAARFSIRRQKPCAPGRVAASSCRPACRRVDPGKAVAPRVWGRLEEGCRNYEAHPDGTWPS